MGKASYRQMTGPDGLIAHRAKFEGNSLSASWHIGRNAELPYAPGTGRLDPEEARAYMMACDLAERSNRRLYVVMSYWTPIAWAFEGEPAYCTPQRFSVTTSKGQGYVRAWINHYFRDTASQGVPPNAEYLAERERIFGKAV
jgi:hypothetical protein